MIHLNLTLVTPSVLYDTTFRTVNLEYGKYIVFVTLHKIFLIRHIILVRLNDHRTLLWINLVLIIINLLYWQRFYCKSFYTVINNVILLPNLTPTNGPPIYVNLLNLSSFSVLNIQDRGSLSIVERSKTVFDPLPISISISWWGVMGGYFSFLNPCFYASSINSRDEKSFNVVYWERDM